jgi:hypothetical protein
MSRPNYREFRESNPDLFPGFNNPPRTFLYAKLKYIYRVLRHNNWNRSETARTLGVSLRTVRYYVIKIKKVGWRVPRSPYWGESGSTLNDNGTFDDVQNESAALPAESVD